MIIPIISHLITRRKRHRAVFQPAPPGYPTGCPRVYCPRDVLPEFVQHSPIALRYYDFLNDIAWQHFPERTAAPDHLQDPTPYAAFSAACLIKIEEGYVYMARLHRFLLEHPALLWLCGFPLKPASHFPWGFDTAASLPTARHFTRLLRQIPNPVFQFLLDETVRLLQQELQAVTSDFAQAISLDTKHIVAWVKENNPKAYVDDRFNKDQQPAGDPDCRLGCKRRRNQHTGKEAFPPAPLTNPRPASHQDVGEFYWGYASGIVATKVPIYGEFVLAELTQTLDRPDVSYFQPLMQKTEDRLGFRPRFGAFDAGFDAFYVYDHFVRPQQDWTQGFAAVPFSKRNIRLKTFDENGHPHCEAGLVMTLKYTFISRATLVEHERGHYICPLLNQDDARCPIDHPRWPEKGGCTHRMPTCPGARVRHEIDRESKLYKNVYKQRTASERINSQARDLGIERPKLRNGYAIANNCTLIYVVINLRALRRVRERKTEPRR